MPPFNSALLKINRAGSQADDLYLQVKAFFDSSDDPAHRVEFERSTDPRKWRAIFRLLKEPPDSWSITLGEIIHNLRSALDHLVYEASAPDENGEPLTGTEYPIFIDKGLFRERAARRIRGLNDATHAFVEEHQPFANDDPEITPYLWLLHQLSNTDKHRLLNVIAIAHTLSDIQVTYSVGTTPLTSEHLIEQSSVNARLENGAEYCAFWTKEPLPADAHVNMNTKIAIEIEFGDPTPTAHRMDVFESLRGMGRLVGGIRREFIKMNPDP